MDRRSRYTIEAVLATAISIHGSTDTSWLLLLPRSIPVNIIGLFMYSKMEQPTLPCSYRHLNWSWYIDRQKLVVLWLHAYVRTYLCVILTRMRKRVLTAFASQPPNCALFVYMYVVTKHYFFEQLFSILIPFLMLQVFKLMEKDSLKILIL